ncbi:MAG: holo-ACP synthase [Mariprofundaceae bacterium]
MIYGVGIDRMAIDRIEKTLTRFGVRFSERVFTPLEYQQAEKKGHVARRLAMLFAAKEAVSKALGTGFRQGMAMHEIEIIHQPIGKPEVVLHGAAKCIADQCDIINIHLSLTDDGGVAMALAVAELG